MRSCGGLPSSSSTTCNRSDGAGLRPDALQQFCGHTRQHEEQAFQIVHRTIQFHPLGQPRFKARFKRHHQVRQGAARQRVEFLPGLSQTGDQVRLRKRGQFAAGADAPCFERLGMFRFERKDTERKAPMASASQSGGTTETPARPHARHAATWKFPAAATLARRPAAITLRCSFAASCVASPKMVFMPRMSSA